MKFSLTAAAFVLAAASSTCNAFNVDGVVSAARSQIGVPYVWWASHLKTSLLTSYLMGGGHGPTPGKTQDGFDCSGLVRYAIWRGAGFDLDSGNTNSQLNHKRTTIIDCNNLQAGDLLFWGKRTDVHHVALASGNGKLIEASRQGVPVHEVNLRRADICARVNHSRHHEFSLTATSTIIFAVSSTCTALNADAVPAAARSSIGTQYVLQAHS
ncbi:hypothetical protein DFQ26_000288, partial [Actinomortierella ambigua]